MGHPTEPVTPPHRTGKLPEQVVVTGKFVAFREDGKPIMLRMPESDAYYLPCFSEERALHHIMGRIGTPVGNVQMINDANEFLVSVPMKCPGGEPLHVILDPWFTPEGRVRFTMLLRD